MKKRKVKQTLIKHRKNIMFYSSMGAVLTGHIMLEPLVAFLGMGSLILSNPDSYSRSVK